MKVKESLNSYKDWKFFSTLSEAGKPPWLDKDDKKKDDKKEKKGEKESDNVNKDITKQGESVIKKVSDNYQRFKSVAGDKIKMYKDFWMVQSSLKAKKDTSAAYKLYDSSYSVFLAPEGLTVWCDDEKTKNPVFVLSDQGLIEKFKAFVSSVMKDMTLEKANYIKKQNTERLGSFLKESDIANDRLFEGLSPDMIQTIVLMVSGLGTLLTATGLTYLIQAMKNSKNKKIQALAGGLEKMGKGAAEGVKKGPNVGGGTNESMSTNLNEMDAASMQLAAQAVIGTLTILLSAGLGTYVQMAMKKSKNENVRKFSELVGKVGKGATAGVKKGPNVGGGTNESLRGNLNEMDAASMQLAAQAVIGTLTILLSAGLGTYVQMAMKKSKNENVRKFSELVGKVGKGAAEGAKKGPNVGGGTNESLNEGLSPDMIQTIVLMVSGIGTLLTATGITYLIQAMKNSKNKKIQALAGGLEKMGKGASAGVKKGPSTTLESLSPKKNLNEGPPQTDTKYGLRFLDWVLEDLQKMGYTFEESDFIIGEAVLSGKAEEAMSTDIKSNDAARLFSKEAMGGLKEDHRYDNGRYQDDPSYRELPSTGDKTDRGMSYRDKLETLDGEIVVHEIDDENLPPALVSLSDIFSKVYEVKENGTTKMFVVVDPNNMQAYTIDGERIDDIDLREYFSQPNIRLA